MKRYRLLTLIANGDPDDELGLLVRVGDADILAQITDVSTSVVRGDTTGTLPQLIYAASEGLIQLLSTGLNERRKKNGHTAWIKPVAGRCDCCSEPIEVGVTCLECQQYREIEP